MNDDWLISVFFISVAAVALAYMLRLILDVL
jgi:hypothetical protein